MIYNQFGRGTRKDRQHVGKPLPFDVKMDMPVKVGNPAKQTLILGRFKIGENLATAEREADSHNAISIHSFQRGCHIK